MVILSDMNGKRGKYQDSFILSENYCKPVKAMEISARNVLKGTVKEINYGQVLAELVIELPGGIEITSLITKSSAENLGLAVGKKASAIIKSSSVMVGID